MEVTSHDFSFKLFFDCKNPIKLINEFFLLELIVDQPDL